MEKKLLTADILIGIKNIPDVFAVQRGKPPPDSISGTAFPAKTDRIISPSRFSSVTRRTAWNISG